MDATSTRGAVVLKGHGAPPVLRTQQVSLDGMILQVGHPVAAGQWLAAELRPPQGGALQAQVRVVWCRSVPPAPEPFVGIEFVGSWGELVGLRRSLAGFIGSHALVGESSVGYVIPEAGGIACYDRQTAKVALIALGTHGFHVRRVDAALEAPTAEKAIQHAFRVREAITFEPALNLPKPPTPPADEENHLGDPFAELGSKSKQADDSNEEEALLGMQTLVLKPDQPLSEAELLGANTLVLAPDKLAASEEIFDMRTMVVGPDAEPGAPKNARSRVLDGDRVVGFVTATSDTSWNLYNVRGKKAAMMQFDAPTYRVVVMGTSSDDSMEFHEVDNAIEGVVRAFELTEPPRIDPPVAGLGC